MALSREVYKALEDIVGAKNISEEPAIMDSYAFNHLRFYVRPAAVLLPGSTEEVQDIVRTCNRYRIRYKAFSSGWGRGCCPTMEGTIQLDLRRMNRILEIDEKNMFAVVEPYVMGGVLQAEAMKLGLNCNFTGAGAATSPLASITSGAGHGPTSIYFGHNSEVMLGVEWVMPDGEILRTGSPGSGLGWFCGEGPGPSLRGVFKAGGGGNLGVFTKVAVKLGPWPGPAELPVEGTVPAYRLCLPENIRAYTLAMPSWQAFAEAAYKIYDAEIGYVCHRQWQLLGEDVAPAFLSMYIDPTRTLDDLEEMLNDPEIQKFKEEMRLSFTIVLAGQTPNDIEYQNKVLDQILVETGGHKIARMNEPDMEQFTLMYFIRWGHKHLNFVFRAREGGWHQYGTPDFNIRYAPLATEVLKKHQETGRLVKTGGDSLIAPIARMGGGGTFSMEQFIWYNPDDKDSVEEMVANSADEAATARENGFAPSFMGARREISREERWASLNSMPDTRRLQWQWKLGQMLDPNDISEGFHYPNT